MEIALGQSRNPCSICRGIDARLAVESVLGSPWNWCSVWRGIRTLARFLACKHLTWQELSDDILVEFRDWVKEEARHKPSSRNDESAKRTANLRLRVIYEFLTWAQEDALLIQSLVGNSATFPVRSSLPKLRNVNHKKLQGDKQKYPKLFQNVGTTSRMSDRQYWATDEDFEAIRQFFWSTGGAD
ncbi:hypothetical protein OKW41_009252 [Paraburkholderia sp. UCT70]|uniref:hypothetical protein n=1 Tax=Paraburkholderia sp. UCT70 TaxID=2991068 RepID=UPI003D1CAA98